MSPAPERRLTAGWAGILFFTTFAWAFSYVSIDFATTEPTDPLVAAFDPHQLTFWRSAIASLLYLPILLVLALQGKWLTARDLGANIAIGIVQYALGMLCFYWAIANGNLLINGLLNGLFPVLLTITARIAGDSIDRRAWPWIFVSFAGTAVLVFGNAGSAMLNEGEAILVPSLVMLLANVLLAFGTLWSRHYADQYPALLINAVQIPSGVLGMWVLIVVGGIPLLPDRPLAPGVIEHTLFLSLVITFATTWLWLLAMTRVPAYQAGMFVYMEPLLVAVLYAILPEYDDRWTLATAIGGALILAGAVVVGTLQEGQRHWTELWLPKTK